MRDRVPLGCLIAAVAITVAGGINPVSRLVWLAESVPVFIAVPVLALTYRRFRFSDAVYLQVLAFISLHELGCHYTYGQVPFTEGLRGAFDRNPYDRVVHFSFGLFVFQGIHEVLFRDEPRRFLRTELFFVFGAISSFGVIYEIIEWLSSGIVSSRAGVAYLGAQGDVWDSQKDLFANSLGALLGMLLLARRQWRKRAH